MSDRDNSSSEIVSVIGSNGIGIASAASHAQILSSPFRCVTHPSQTEGRQLQRVTIIIIIQNASWKYGPNWRG